MTKNQIDYWTFRETERANRARELETHRANVTQEQEKERSNKMNESISLYDVAEKQRHDTEMENYNLMSLEESARHNTVTEGETIRSNLAKEEENRRHAMVAEAETERHDIASEAINRSAVGAQYAAVSESARHNMQMEQLQEVSNSIAAEKVSSEFLVSAARNEETQRANMAAEEEKQRHNVAEETEKERHDKQTELIDLMDTGVGLTKTLLPAVLGGLAIAL